MGSAQDCAGIWGLLLEESLFITEYIADGTSTTVLTTPKHHNDNFAFNPRLEIGIFI